jgi:hypothetical protein
MTQEYDSEGRPVRRKTGWVLWTALGCGCLILLLGGFGAGLFFFVKNIASQPEKVVHEFLAAAAAGDTAKAYAYFSAPLKEEQPYATFEQMVKGHPSLFQVKDTTFNRRSIDTREARYSGTVELASGTKMPASFRLVRENGGWKLLSYKIGDE